MSSMFITILNMSLTGAFVIAVICLARLLLKRSPKIFSYCLWAVVGVRLLLPFSIESMWGIVPFGAQAIPQQAVVSDVRPGGGSYSHYGLDHEVFNVPQFYMYEIPGQAWDDTAALRDNNAAIRDNTAALHNGNTARSLFTIAAFAWLGGFTILFLYGIVSFFILKWKMRKSVHMHGNIYEASNINSPFVLGLFVPKIYLPVGLPGREREYVILHEQIHVKRYDHIVKFLAFFILCLHWFNPLAWLAFKLMSADMEMSCDERVLKDMGIEETKQGYSLSLVSLATEKIAISGSPLAFGVTGIKGRVKNVLNFKKRSKILSAVAILLVIVLSIGLMLNQAEACIDDDAPPVNEEYYQTEDGEPTSEAVSYGRDVHVVYPAYAVDLSNPDYLDGARFDVPVRPGTTQVIAKITFAPYPARYRFEFDSTNYDVYISLRAFPESRVNFMRTNLYNNAKDITLVDIPGTWYLVAERPAMPDPQSDTFDRVRGSVTYAGSETLTPEEFITQHVTAAETVPYPPPAQLSQAMALPFPPSPPASVTQMEARQIALDYINSPVAMHGLMSAFGTINNLPVYPFLISNWVDSHYFAIVCTNSGHVIVAKPIGLDEEIFHSELLGINHPERWEVFDLIFAIFGGQRTQPDFDSLISRIPSPSAIMGDTFFSGNINWPNINSVTGEGEKILRNIDVTNFTGINIRNSFNIIYRESATHAVRIKMQENLFDPLNVYVENGILQVYFTGQHFIMGRHNIPRLYIYAPYLNHLTFSGSANTVDWDTIRVPHLTITASGAANVTLDLDVDELVIFGSGAVNFDLSGTADAATMYISGAVNFCSQNLQSRNARVYASGACNVNVYATGSINIHASGTAQVFYLGGAQVTRHVSGLAAVRRG